MGFFNELSADKKVFCFTVGCIAGVIGIGIICNTMDHYDTVEAISKKLDLSMKDLKGMSKLEIKDAIVEKAVRDVAYSVAKEAVYTKANSIANNLQTSMRNDIDKKVGSCVSKMYESMKGDVEKAVRRKIDKIDIDDIKNKLVDRIEDKVSDAVEDKIDDILSDYEGGAKKVIMFN